MPLIFGSTTIDECKFVQNNTTTDITEIYYKSSQNAQPVLVWQKVQTSWHTTFSGDNQEFITPDGTYHEVWFSNLGTVPSGTQKVRASGSIYTFDDSSQTTYNSVSFSQVEIGSSWTYVVQIQDTGGSSEIIMRNNNGTIQAVVRGTCYYPYIQVGQITLIEALY